MLDSTHCLKHPPRGPLHPLLLVNLSQEHSSPTEDLSTMNLNGKWSQFPSHFFQGVDTLAKLPTVYTATSS